MAQAVRIATFNLENLDLWSGDVPLARRAAVLRPQIERLRADVLCLQEVNAQKIGARTGEGGERLLRALDILLADLAYSGFERIVGRRPDGRLVDHHNLVILSRFPVRRSRSIRHDLVAPLAYRPVTARPRPDEPEPLEWERPVVHAALDVGGRTLHVLNLHLRAPRAAFVAGHKRRGRWKDMAGWSEGMFLAAVKQAGQGLETRLYVDRLFDADPNALIAACGDFNADDDDIAVRIIRGDAEDAENPALESRVLLPVERSLPAGERYSVRHHGAKLMLDHLLVSAPLAKACRGAWIDHADLVDETEIGRDTPQSSHAPVVAEFLLS